MERGRGVLDGFHLGQALGPIANLLGRRCGANAVKLLRDRLAETVGAPEEDRYSYLWRPAVEDHEQNTSTSEYRAKLLEALRDTALGATAAAGDDACRAVRTLLTDSHPILVRVGIFVCAENYAAVGDEFWRCFDTKWLVHPVYWHELYWLLKKNFLRFAAADRSRFLTLVRELHGEWRTEERTEDWDERHRRDVLHPVAGLGDAEVDALYDGLVKRWGPVREHPDFHSYHSAGWVGERSPVTPDALLALGDAELVKLFTEFKPRPGTWDGPTFRGLASTLSDAVRASDDGFASKLPLFVSLQRPYQHGVLEGLRHRVNDDKKPIDWLAAVHLIEQIVHSPAFREELKSAQPGGWEPSIHWVINDAADLLKASVSEESVADRDLHERSLRILQAVLAAVPATPAAELDDPVSHTINTPRGRSLEAMVNIALGMRRPKADDAHLKEGVWALIGPTLAAELNESVRGANGEFATVAGLYCANLHFLNDRWVEQEFDRLFSTENHDAWKCAAEGFAYQRYLYEWLFRYLRDGGHLRRMIAASESSNQVAEKALQFLALAYLEGEERLDGKGILSELVDGLSATHITQLCWFFWTLRGTRGEAPSPQGERILAFWRRVSEAGHSTGAQPPEILSALNQLAPFIQELDGPTTSIWAEAAKYANVNYHGHVLLENLARLAPKYPLQVYEVFRAALSAFLPDFEAEDVVRCVQGIANAGHLDEAEWLCNEYANQGSNLLKPTYESLRGRGKGSASAE